MIDERELIKALRKNSIFEKVTVGEETVYDVIDRLPKVVEWISCKDRLPSQTGRYIVTTKATNQLNETYYNVVEATYWVGSQKWEDVVDDISLYVIAWTHLPEPYKGD